MSGPRPATAHLPGSLPLYSDFDTCTELARAPLSPRFGLHLKRYYIANPPKPSRISSTFPARIDIDYLPDCLQKYLSHNIHCLPETVSDMTQPPAMSETSRHTRLHRFDHMKEGMVVVARCSLAHDQFSPDLGPNNRNYHFFAKARPVVIYRVEINEVRCL